MLISFSLSGKMGKPMSKTRQVSNFSIFVFAIIFLLYTKDAFAFSLKDSLSNLFNSGNKSTSTYKEYERKETVQNLKFLEPEKALAQSLQNSEPGDITSDTENSLKAGKSLANGEEIIESRDNQTDKTIYTVQEGDTLDSIASYFNISASTIRETNKDKKIKSGVVLEIPQIDVSLYKVLKGDTLEQIALKFKIDADDISLFNGFIRSEDLTTGDEIYLPGVKTPDVVVVKNNGNKVVKKDKNKNSLAKDISKYIPKAWVVGDTSHLNILSNVNKFVNLQKITGYFIFPAPGANRTQKLHGNNGCDLANYIGAPVVASAGGVVRTAKTGGYNFGIGNYIVITHDNGTETVYGHLSEVDVQVGQSVSRGQNIGKVGNSGNSTGPHLHFEIHGAYNPWAW